MVVDIGPYLEQMLRMGEASGKSDGIIEAGKIIDRFFHEDSSRSLLDIYVDLHRALNDASYVHVEEYCDIISKSRQTAIIPVITPEGVTA